jgi:hypothetical protein
VAFFIALLVKQRIAIMLFVFSLPILPDIHLQLEAILKPAVKYFVGHPGLDVVAGLCLGLWIKRIWFSKKVEPVFTRVNWALGLLIIVIAASSTLAVMRNLEINSVFDINLLTLLNEFGRFKLINHPNSYLPFVDLLTYSFAILTVCILVPIFNGNDLREREEIVFKPLMFGLIFSAGWGIFQAFTGIGLSQRTLDVRPESFGFGAQGFQPDIHAFAALMLIGTFGLFGYLKRVGKHDLAIGYACIGICWIALILSKSKATFIFAVITSVVVLAVSLNRKGVALHKLLSALFLALFTVGFLLLITNNFVWMEYLGQLLAPSNWSRENFNRAFVYRPELFRAALCMFSDYPIFGIGQGNFFRLSSNIEISHSMYLAQSGGDNAHNYFLQTLAETGLLGTLAFALAIGWPIYRQKHFADGAAPVFAIAAIALGNLFSHPLLIRPNLILFAVFLALMYSSIEDNEVQSRGKADL